MKKIITLFVMINSYNLIVAQADFLTHTGSGGWYLGWNNSIPSNALDLNIEHQGTRNIFFSLGTPGIPSGQIDQSAFRNTSYGYGTFNAVPTGTNNSVFGRTAGFALTSGSDNVFMGFDAGRLTTIGNKNVFIGTGAGRVTDEDNNSFLGFESGNVNTLGRENAFFGYWSGLNNIVGIENTFLGAQSGQANTSGDYNTFVGEEAGFSNTIEVNNTHVGRQSGFLSRGNNNTFLGHQSGYNTNADSNVFVGISSGFINNSGQSNTFIGSLSGASSSGSNNTMLGNNTGFNDQTGGLNTFIGYMANSDFTTPSLRNASAIGANSIVATDHTVIIGGGNSTDHCMVGIGSSNFVNGPNAKLDVKNDASNWTNPPLPNNTGISNYAGVFETYGTNLTPAVSYWGIRSQSSVRNSPFNNIGGDFRAWNCDINNIGVLGVSDGTVGNYNYGGKFYACNAHVANYGIYAESCPMFPGDPQNYAGYFVGNVNINGAGTITTLPWTTSDQMFKTNIDSIPNTMPIIKQLKPRKYYMDTVNSYGLNFSNRKQYGFIAQDVETILPELVTNTTKPADIDSAGSIIHPSVTYKSLNYNAFIALLMRGIQEQQRTIDSLTTNNTKQDSINNYVQHQIAQLTNIINDCCERHGDGDDGDDNGHHDDGHHSPISNTNIKLTDVQNIVLEQNVPNPFAEQTTINYSLPDNTGKAQILFYNASGKLIQSVELTARGSASLNVFAQDLSNGSYTYTLIADGKIIDTKKMVKQ